MGTRPRTKPQHLPRKLLAIRQRLQASQSGMAKLLGNKVSPARLSEYEHGIREPDLFMLLRYAQVSRVRLEALIDDERELTFPKNLKSAKEGTPTRRKA